MGSLKTPPPPSPQSASLPAFPSPCEWSHLPFTASIALPFPVPLAALSLSVVAGQVQRTLADGGFQEMGFHGNLRRMQDLLLYILPLWGIPIFTQPFPPDLYVCIIILLP